MGVEMIRSLSRKGDPNSTDPEGEGDLVKVNWRRETDPITGKTKIVWMLPEGEESGREEGGVDEA